MRKTLLLLAAFLVALPLHALERQPRSTYHARRQALAARLNNGVAVLFAAEEPLLDFMPYRQDSDFYYLTGWTEPGAALLVSNAGGAYREVMLLPMRDLRMERYTGKKLDALAPDAAKETGVDEVQPLTALPSLVTELRVKQPRLFHGSLYIETDMPQAQALAPWTAATLGMSTPPEVRNVRDLVNELRAAKDDGELALLKKAADASVRAQFAMMQSTHPGQRERTVAGILLEKLLENGCERPSYAPIVGSGANSTVLHYADNSATMQDGDVVVVDAAGEYSMYASDITRTVPINGHFTARQREIYDVVLGAQKAAIDAFVAGKSYINDPGHEHPDSLDTVAFHYMNEHGRDLHGEGLGKYFIHGIGHSVGMDVHDPYDYSKPIQKGMVFTIEPGIYIPEEKLGVRIEDVFYVQPDGKLLNLTAALPKEAAAVEAAMRLSGTQAK